MSASDPLFRLGQVTATPGAMELLQRGDTPPGWLLRRHVTGDWGTLDDHDRAANDTAVQVGNRIFSQYEVAGERIWVITESDRSVTTFLLPEEY